MLLYKTNRFHVAIGLFSNRSQRTSKCGKNISDTLGCASCATFLFLPHFDITCDLLLNRRTATWNLFVKQTMVNLEPCSYLVQYMLHYNPFLWHYRSNICLVCAKQRIKYFCWSEKDCHSLNKKITRSCHFKSQGHKSNQWSWSLFIPRQQFSLVHRIFSINYSFTLFIIYSFTQQSHEQRNWWKIVFLIETDLTSLPQNTTAIFELPFSLSREKKTNNQNKIREYNLYRKLKSL